MGNLVFQDFPEFLFPCQKLEQLLFGWLGVVGTQDDGHHRVVGQYAQLFQFLQVAAQLGKAAASCLDQIICAQGSVIR